MFNLKLADTNNKNKKKKKKKSDFINLEYAGIDPTILNLAANEKKEKESKAFHQTQGYMKGFEDEAIKLNIGNETPSLENLDQNIFKGDPQKFGEKFEETNTGQLLYNFGQELKQKGEIDTEYAPLMLAEAQAAKKLYLDYAKLSTDKNIYKKDYEQIPQFLELDSGKKLPFKLSLPESFEKYYPTPESEYRSTGFNPEKRLEKRKNELMNIKYNPEVFSKSVEERQDILLEPKDIETKSTKLSKNINEWLSKPMQEEEGGEETFENIEEDEEDEEEDEYYEIQKGDALKTFQNIKDEDNESEDVYTDDEGKDEEYIPDISQLYDSEEDEPNVSEIKKDEENVIQLKEKTPQSFELSTQTAQEEIKEDTDIIDLNNKNYSYDDINEQIQNTTSFLDELDKYKEELNKQQEEEYKKLKEYNESLKNYNKKLKEDVIDQKKLNELTNEKKEQIKEQLNKTMDSLNNLKNIRSLEETKNKFMEKRGKEELNNLKKKKDRDNYLNTLDSNVLRAVASKLNIKYTDKTKDKVLKENIKNELEKEEEKQEIKKLSTDIVEKRIDKAEEERQKKEKKKPETTTTTEKEEEEQEEKQIPASRGLVNEIGIQSTRNLNNLLKNKGNFSMQNLKKMIPYLGSDLPKKYKNLKKSDINVKNKIEIQKALEPAIKDLINNEMEYINYREKQSQTPIKKRGSKKKKKNK